MAQRGRPAKTWEEVKAKLPDDWFEQLEELASQGKVELHFKLKLRKWVTFSNDLWSRFKQDEKEFSDCLKDLGELSAAWWFDKVQSSIDMGKECNATALIFGASNAHPDHFRRNVEKKEQNEGGTQTIVFKFGEEGLKANG